VVIGADHIEVLGNRVLGPDPHDLHSLVAEAVHAERGIVDVRIVDRVTSLANAVFDPCGRNFTPVVGAPHGLLIPMGEMDSSRPSRDLL
jgi:hypothetical protein